MKPFADPAVEVLFRTYPPRARERLLALRELVFKTAAETSGVGELHETLKWGEPAYVTARTGSGSTVRLGWKARSPDQYAMYFHCQTGLVDSFRTLFPNDFRFEGNRALLFQFDEEVPTDVLALCIEAALTYHKRKRMAKSAASPRALAERIGAN
ncbi:MAG: DUF1801 domain-containing protein [Gemmataceae bacterium]